MIYRMSKKMFRSEREIHDGKGKVIGLLPKKELIDYINLTYGLKGTITEIEVSG